MGRPQNRSEDIQVQSGSFLNVRSGLSCQNRHHVAAAGLDCQVVRCLTSSVLQPHTCLTPETRKTGDDVMKWEELSKQETSDLIFEQTKRPGESYLSRSAALCSPSEPKAAASCRAVFFILRTSRTRRQQNRTFTWSLGMVNVTTVSRLLVCKPSWDSQLLEARQTLRICSFQRTVNFSTVSCFRSVVQRAVNLGS